MCETVDPRLIASNSIRNKISLTRYFYEYLRAIKCATVIRFHMTTRISLSLRALDAGISPPLGPPAPGLQIPNGEQKTNPVLGIRNPSKPLKT
jgi:hypothetical protein